MSPSPGLFPEARGFSKSSPGYSGSYPTMYGTEEVRSASKGSADRIVMRPYLCACMRQAFDYLQAFSEGDCKRLRTSTIAGARSVW